MKNDVNLEDISFEGFEGLPEEKDFLLEKVQNIIEKLPSDSRFFVQFQKTEQEYFCSFKSISLKSAFFAIVSGNSTYTLQKKMSEGIQNQIEDWHRFRSENTNSSFNRFVPKRFSFFNKKTKSS